MTLSLYDVSIPVFLRSLDMLSRLLDKAAMHVETEGLKADDLINARLAPDMFPLARQIQSASDAAKSCAARLSGQEAPSFPDTEKTFPELQDRIAKTKAFLASIKRDGFGDVASITLPLRQPLTFEPQAYLLTFALPNFLFHATTTYDILRQQGVTIGKMDYLGPF